LLIFVVGEINLPSVRHLFASSQRIYLPQIKQNTTLEFQYVRSGGCRSLIAINSPGRKPLAIRLSLGTQEIQMAGAKPAKPNHLRITRNVDGEVGA